MNPKYQRAIDELDKKKITKMKVFGNSMTPIIQSRSTLTFTPAEDYTIGDVVFCKVGGRIIDAHMVTSKHSKRGYLISNHHGYDNGWTKTIYGKVIEINGIPFRNHNA